VKLSKDGKEAFRNAIERFAPMDASDLELLLGSAEERSLRLPRGSAPSDPALSSSVAVTPVRVVVVPWARIGEVRYAHPAWNRFSVRVLEHFYLLKARREYEPLALDAAGRYDVFRQAFPGLEDRVKKRLTSRPTWGYLRSI
jgi:hypothetical protein